MYEVFVFFFSSRRRHTRWTGDWSSDVCSSDLGSAPGELRETESVLDVPRFSRLECPLRRRVLFGQSLHKPPWFVRRLIDPFLPQIPDAPAFFQRQLEFLDDETEERVVVLKGG